MNIAVSTFKNVFLKKISIFLASGFMGPDWVFDHPFHIDYYLRGKDTNWQIAFEFGLCP
jgi:hypothetical protein